MLFFFCSGFTLFLGKNIDFFNWYKRRVNRIYPTVFAWALVQSVLFTKEKSFIDVILFGGSWFVSCIMIYYIILWIVKTYLINRLSIVMFVSLLMTIAWYFCFCYSIDKFSMYGGTYFMWCHMFNFMLLGSIFGLKYKNNAIKRWTFLKAINATIISVVAFYFLFSFSSKSGIANSLQLLSIVPLFSFCISLYQICNSCQLIKVYTNIPFIKSVVRIISGLCLEIYLVQILFLTDCLNSLFPLNICVIFLGIGISAYLLRCIARIWSQTFKDEDYSWKKVTRF